MLDREKSASAGHHRPASAISAATIAGAVRDIARAAAARPAQPKPWQAWSARRRDAGGGRPVRPRTVAAARASRSRRRLRAERMAMSRSCAVSRHQGDRDTPSLNPSALWSYEATSLRFSRFLWIDRMSDRSGRRAIDARDLQPLMIRPAQKLRRGPAAGSCLAEKLVRSFLRRVSSRREVGEPRQDRTVVRG